jgi:ATP-binding protein involved in chromosome partitioning
MMKNNDELTEQNKKIQKTMKHIRHKIAVISGKGGVGKSTVAANIATAFAVQGHRDRVGILDIDIHGPCIPKLLGVKKQRYQVSPLGLGALPVKGPMGLKVVSMDFLLQNQDTPVIWRGPLKMQAIRQFLSDFLWGELDYLVIDVPPGTGDEPLSVMQLIPDMDGTIIVTIPSDVSGDVVKKSGQLFTANANPCHRNHRKHERLHLP